MKTFTLLLLLFSPLFCFPQLTVTPVVGLELNTFGGRMPKEHFYPLNTSEWESKSLIIGLTGTQNLSKKNYLTIKSLFTKNSENAFFRVQVPFTSGIDYCTLFNNVTIKRQFGKLIRAEAGVGLNMYFNIKNDFPLDKEADGEIIRSRFFDFGLPLGIEIQKYGIVLNLTYFQGIIGHNIWKHVVIPPIQNFWIYLGYEIEL
ncbi:MAG: hypothetical protein KDC24_03900 [Saprospiraceae bacterium]|nr:hypothetical protein [Saprospiraceae bacterium]